ncbi:MAG: hypothetical protein Q4P31_07330, partial [Andreesenia angusta]|nr:hypothetical protein [Andreesenia angusta]
ENGDNFQMNYFENSMILELPDGNVNQIFKTDLMLKRKKYIQIMAYDITRKYKILSEIEKKNKELEKYNRELYEVLKNIEELILDKKAISIRQKVHDIIGQRLSIIVMAVREREALEESRADLHELNELIDTLLEDLKKESMEENLDIFEYLIESFKLIGVKIIIQGEIPKKNEIKTNVNYILREAVTNAIYHAEADEVYMKVEEDEYYWFISIWDNGKIKKSSFSEGVGLKGIKRRVETVMNGQLKIDYSDKFVLNFKIPK